MVASAPCFRYNSPMNEEIAAFQAWLRLDKGLSANTVASYCRDLAAFQEHFQNRPLAGTRESDILAYLAFCRDRRMKAVTVQRKLSALRSFFRYLQAEAKHDPGADPTAHIDAPKKDRNLPRTLSLQEVELLLAAPETDSLSGKQERTILELLYACGLRISELIALGPGAVDWEQQCLRVHGKGDKERLVPFGGSAALWLRTQIDEVLPKLDPGYGVDRLFVAGGPGSPRPYTRQTLWQRVRWLARRAGIRQAVSPHMLRHSCASHLLQGGMNLRLVQTLLGHADISTTQLYTHVEERRLVEAHQRFHPRR